MKNKINININNLGSINNAEIDINSINIVSGVNSSGKSLLTKILFCFLTDMSESEELVKNNIHMKRTLNFNNVFYIDSQSILDKNRKEEFHENSLLNALTIKLDEKDTGELVDSFKNDLCNLQNGEFDFAMKLRDLFLKGMGKFIICLIYHLD